MIVSRYSFIHTRYHYYHLLTLVAMSYFFWESVILHEQPQMDFVWSIKFLCLCSFSIHNVCTIKGYLLLLVFHVCKKSFVSSKTRSYQTFEVHLQLNNKQRNEQFSKLCVVSLTLPTMDKNWPAVGQKSKKHAFLQIFHACFPNILIHCWYQLP